MTEPIFRIPDDIVHGPEYSALAEVPTNWGHAAVRIEQLWTAGGDGEGMIIGVIDTGIDANHPEFKDKIIAAQSFIQGESVADGNGHGTHVACTAAGTSRQVSYAPKAKLVIAKGLSNRGSGGMSSIRAAFEFCVNNGATHVNMSIGGAGFMEGMEDLFQWAIKKGCTPLIAAGNERQEGGVVRFPSSAIVVASVNERMMYSPFSNPAATNAILSFAAPGSNVVSARSGGGYVSMSGTSMATPTGTGTLAANDSGRVKLGQSRLTVAEYRVLFERATVEAGPVGPDRDYGAGLLNATLLRWSYTPPPIAG